MTGNLNLRIAVHAHAAVLHLAERLGRHLDELREEDDRGNNDVSMIMWIVAVVVFAGDQLDSGGSPAVAFLEDRFHHHVAGSLPPHSRHHVELFDVADRFIGPDRGAE